MIRHDGLAEIKVVGCRIVELKPRSLLVGSSHSRILPEGDDGLTEVRREGGRGDLSRSVEDALLVVVVLSPRTKRDG